MKPIFAVMAATALFCCCGEGGNPHIARTVIANGEWGAYVSYADILEAAGMDVRNVASDRIRQVFSGNPVDTGRRSGGINMSSNLLIKATITDGIDSLEIIVPGNNTAYVSMHIYDSGKGTDYSAKTRLWDMPLALHGTDSSVYLELTVEGDYAGNVKLLNGYWKTENRHSVWNRQKAVKMRMLEDIEDIIDGF